MVGFGAGTERKKWIQPSEYWVFATFGTENFPRSPSAIQFKNILFTLLLFVVTTVIDLPGSLAAVKLEELVCSKSFAKNGLIA